MSKQLWTPPKIDKNPKFFCRLCKTQFLTEKVMERHVLSCNAADIDELRARQRSAVDEFYGPGIDPEWEKYNDALRRAGIDPEVQYNRGRRSGIRRASES